VAEQVDTTAGCSLEGAGLGIGRCVGGRHEARLKGIKKGGKPMTCHLFEYGKKKLKPINGLSLHRYRSATGRRSSVLELS